jgi:hypothetical protein
MVKDMYSSPVLLGYSSVEMLHMFSHPAKLLMEVLNFREDSFDATFFQ